MSDLIQSKIWKAFRKVGSKLGKKYDVFKATSANDPLNTSNWIGSVDTWFRQKTDDGITFTAYFDPLQPVFEQVEIGSYFATPTRSEIFYISNISFNKIVGILCESTIQVYRSFYQGTDLKESLIYSDIPARITSGSSSQDGSYIPVASQGNAPIPRYIIRVGSPDGSFELQDKIVDNFGRSSKVTDCVWNGEYILRTAADATTS